MKNIRYTFSDDNSISLLTVKEKDEIKYFIEKKDGDLLTIKRISDPLIFPLNYPRYPLLLISSPTGERTIYFWPTLNKSIIEYEAGFYYFISMQYGIVSYLIQDILLDKGIDSLSKGDNRFRRSLDLSAYCEYNKLKKITLSSKATRADVEINLKDIKDEWYSTGEFFLYLVDNYKIPENYLVYKE